MREVACAGVALLAAAILAGCELLNPEVVVRNDLGAPVQIRELSFNGCVWPVLLAPGESTSPCACPPGVERVRFKRFDAQAYVNEILEVIARGGHGYPRSDDRVGVRLPTPLWFSYRTRSPFALGYGDFQVLRVLPDEIEEDFDVPGPYGH